MANACANSVCSQSELKQSLFPWKVIIIMAKYGSRLQVCILMISNERLFHLAVTNRFTIQKA